MAWGRPKNYHGSRTYQSDEIVVGQPGLMAAWLANIVGKLFKPGGQSSSSAASLAEDEREFSLLGRDGRPTPLDRAADCPFPTRAATLENDRRVYP